MYIIKETDLIGWAALLQGHVAALKLSRKSWWVPLEYANHLLRHQVNNLSKALPNIMVYFSCGELVGIVLITSFVSCGGRVLSAHVHMCLATQPCLCVWGGGLMSTPPRGSPGQRL